MHKLRQLRQGDRGRRGRGDRRRERRQALADPIGSSGKAVTPQSYDIVSVRADTDQYLFDQLSVDYNKTVPAKLHSAKHPYVYNWDATKPGTTSSAPSTISTKKGCKPIIKPNGGTMRPYGPRQQHGRWQERLLH